MISRLLEVVVRSLGFGRRSLVHGTIVQGNYIKFKVNVDVDVEGCTQSPILTQLVVTNTIIINIIIIIIIIIIILVDIIVCLTTLPTYEYHGKKVSKMVPS